MLMRFYGAGLEQVVSVIRAGGGDAMVHRLSADPLVAGLLALHDLHPVPVAHGSTTRWRPRGAVGSHGDGITLGEIDDDGAVHVLLAGRRLRRRHRQGRGGAADHRACPRSPGSFSTAGPGPGPRSCRSGGAGKLTPFPARFAGSSAGAGPRAGAPAGEVRAVRHARAAAAPAPRAGGERRMVCACGPCGFLFDNPGAGGGSYRRVPDRYLVDPVHGHRRAVGRARHPRQHRVLPAQHGAGPDHRLLPQPGRGHRERARPRRLAHRRSAPGAWRAAAARRRGAARAAAAHRVPARADRRVLPARRPGEAALARLRRRQRGVGGDRRLLRGRCRAEARPATL